MRTPFEESLGSSAIGHSDRQTTTQTDSDNWRDTWNVICPRCKLARPEHHGLLWRCGDAVDVLSHPLTRHGA